MAGIRLQRRPATNQPTGETAGELERIIACCLLPGNMPGIFVSPREGSMSEVSFHVDEFLSYLRETGRKPRTIEAYKGRLVELVDLVGSRPIETIKLEELASIFKPGDVEGGRWKTENTFAMRVQVVKTFFQFCTNKGYIPVSPASKLSRPTRGKPKQETTGALYLVSAPASPSLSMMAGRDLSSLMDEFLFYLKAMGRRERTIEEYQKRLIQVVDFFIGWNIEKISSRSIDQYVSVLSTRLAVASLGSHIQSLKTFFKFCVSRGYIPYSPAGHLKRIKVGHVNPNKVISQNSLEAMISFTANNGMILDHCLLIFMADTGCRVGELVSMNLETLDLLHREAIVDGKTGLRPIYFIDPTVAALRSWLAIRPATDEHAVFTTREGRISIASIYHRLERIAAQLGIKRFNPQSIRHRVGQSWVDQGVNLELVRIKLGHSDVNTTAKFYTHQDKERAKQASSKYSIVSGLS